MVVIGGAAMDGPRHIWWNFVSSRKDRIEAAKADWKAGRFDPVPGDTLTRYKHVILIGSATGRIESCVRGERRTRFIARELPGRSARQGYRR
jgi:hypothetical protein